MGCRPFVDTKDDNEVNSQLWGEWPAYTIGSLDALDWSGRGRQSY